MSHKQFISITIFREDASLPGHLVHGKDAEIHADLSGKYVGLRAIFLIEKSTGRVAVCLYGAHELDKGW